MEQGTEQPEIRLEATPQRHIIERPRLTKLLDNADARIVLLIAPAGYGKTTLAREWTEQGGRVGLWYRARRGSSDVAIVARSLSQALAPLSPTIERSTRELLSALNTPEEEPEVVADLLVEELDGWPDDTWLVIDEYELVSPNPGPVRVIERFVEGSGAKVLITGRERPNWVTPRDLLYGDAFELRAAALSMTLEEASQVLEYAGRRSAGLVALADGWPAVIGLAALLPGEVKPTTDDQSALFDYVAQELFDELDSEVQKDLVLLSVPATLTPALVHAVLGDDAEKVMQDATRVGLMTLREPNELDIHPLCRAFLESKVGDIGVSHEQIDKLTASLIDAEQWDDAFGAISTFGLEQQLALLIERGLRRVLADGRLALVERWISWADGRHLTAPELALAQAETYFRRGSWALSESLAVTAARTLTSNDLRAQAHLCAGSSAHLQDEVERAWEQYGEALASDGPPYVRRRALWGRFATSYWTKLAHYAEALTELRQETDPSPEHLLRLRQASVTVALRDGDLTRAVDAAIDVEPLLSHVEDVLVRCSFLSSVAYALGAAARYTEAHQFASRQEEEATRFHLAFAVPTAVVNQAMAKLGLGLYNTTMVLLEQSERQDTTKDPFLVVERVIVRAYVALSKGEPQRAVDLLSAVDLESTRSDLAGETIATRALAESCCGYATRANESMNSAACLVNEVKGKVVLACTNAVLALGKERSDTEQQLAQLAATIDQTGCLDSAICAMRASPQLLAAAAKHPDMTRILAIAAARSGDPALAAAVGKRLDADRQREALSPREIEVLQFASQGFRNSDIAQRLFISPTTVKTHLQNIYKKLGVGSRTEAAMRAKEAGLLS